MGVERRPEPFPVGGVLIQDKRSPGAWVLEYPLTNSFFFCPDEKLPGF